MTLIIRRRILGRISLGILGPVAVFLAGGPLTSAAYADIRDREERLREAAARAGLDPQILLDPEGWEARIQAETLARREAALALLPRSERPAWFSREVDQVQRAQAIHTLAGLGKDLREGRSVHLEGLPAATIELAKAARKSRVRLTAPAPTPARSMARLAAAPRAPRSKAPASWRDLDVLGHRFNRLPGIGRGPADLRDLWRGRGRGSPSHDARGPIGLRVDSRLPVLAGLLPVILHFPPAFLFLLDPVPADLSASVEAPSDDPRIVQKAEELGRDPTRIFAFVRDGISTELYAGSLKGAVGTLREGAGNDVDQSSLLVALLRASGIPARYEIGTIALTPAQANAYAGAEELSVSASAIASTGVGTRYVPLGPGRGMGLEVEHTWVRAFVPTTAYRGVSRPGGSSGWVHLSPALERVETSSAVDLRDVPFDFAGYLAGQKPLTPLETHEEALHDAIELLGEDCDTLESAQKIRRVVAEDLPLLPSELPAERRSTLATLAELPADVRHMVRIEAFTSQGARAMSYEASMASLWGKNISVVYEPATVEDAQVIAEHGGLESTPAFRVRLAAVLEIDGEEVARGAPEAPGLDQKVRIDLVSPAMGLRRIEHRVVAGGVYAFALDPGKVPQDLVAERIARQDGLSGDELEAEKLYVAALDYLRELGESREELAGLVWHRTFKEVEEAAAEILPRVAEYNGVPLSISRDFFVLDAVGLAFGDFSVDGDHHRSNDLVHLVALHGSVLEHVIGERFRGPRQFSAVKLVQIANEQGVAVETFGRADVEEALLQIDWPEDVEDRLRDHANRGLTVQAPVRGHTEPGLATLYGFIATDPMTGAGAYIVELENTEIFGGAGDNGEPGQGDPGCAECGESGPGSLVHLFSGNYAEQVTDLMLPARGIPLVFERTYNAQLPSPGPLGRGWTHSYMRRLAEQADGSLTWTDRTGIPWRFAPDGDGWAPPPKKWQKIERDGGGWLMRYPDGLVERYDEEGRLWAEEDPNGHQVLLEHDAAGKLSIVRGDGGSFVSLEYGGPRITRVVDSAGREVFFQYDAAGDLVRDTDVLANPRTYGYDSDGRMRERTDLLGHTTRMDYDAGGRVVRITYPDGSERTYAYDFRNNKTLHTDRAGNPTLYELSDLAQPVRVVDSLRNERAMTYDSRGLRTSAFDARGNLTTWSYDDDGNVLETTDPLGATTSFTYGPLSRLLTTTDALGNTSTNEYDASGNLLFSTDALGNVTGYTYEDGLPASITRPGGSTTSMSYDAAGNVTSITDPEGGVTSLAYDAAGQLTAMTDANGDTRTMQVDARGQLLSMTDPAGSVTGFSYDAAGNRTSAQDPDGNVTSFEYDEMSGLVATADALGRTSRAEYDAEGRVTASTDPRGFRTEMRYDAAGRLLETTDALGQATTLGYCAEIDSQPCHTVDALGNTNRVELDELGREVASIDPLGNRQETEYDILGRRISTTDPIGRVTSFTYDALGRLETVTDAAGNVTAYGYDARGNRTSVTDANGNVTVFEYDLANRLIRETTPIGTVTEFSYDSSGNRTSKLDGNGQLTRFIYDSRRRLTDILYHDGTSAHFDFDDRGNRIHEQNEDSTRDRTYDEIGQLASVYDAETGRTIRYAYDASGNRASMRVEPDGQETTYAWDARGNLVRMTDPEGGEYHFAYDDAGRRTTTTYPNGMTLRTVYDQASQIVSMVYRNPAGQVLESFAYSYDSRGNRTAKIFADGGAELYGYDDLSRLTRATYPSGRSVEYVYDGVGNRLEMTERGGTPAPPCEGDADCDGVPDDFDNCGEIQNVDQADTDAPEPILADTVAYYRFDETSGTVAADTASGHGGTLEGGVARIADGQRSHALRFDGVDDAVVATVPMGGATAASLEAWVTTSTPEQGWGTYIVSLPQPFGGMNGFDLGVNWENIRSCLTTTEFNGACLEIPQNYADGQYHHMAATYDGSFFRLYWDGEEVGSQEATGTLIAGADELSIGQYSPGASYFTGDIDEVGIYARPLTSDEIATHATLPLPDEIGDACDPCPLSIVPTCTPLTCRDDDGDGYGIRGASKCTGEPADSGAPPDPAVYSLFDCCTAPGRSAPFLAPRPDLT